MKKGSSFSKVTPTTNKQPSPPQYHSFATQVLIQREIMGYTTAGPSPVVPCIIVGFLGMIIFWPTLQSIWESVESLLELGIWVAVILLFLLLLVHLLSIFFPVLHVSSTFAVQHSSSPGYDADGFGFGSGALFLGLLFLVLYNLL